MRKAGKMSNKTWQKILILGIILVVGSLVAAGRKLTVVHPEDIGEALGCGAHVAGLRRTGVGALDEFPMHTLESLQALADAGDLAALDALLVPMESTLPDWPEVRLSEDASFYLCQGQPVFVPQVKERGWVRLYAGDKRFLGLGTVLDDGRVAPKRLLSNS